jgi:hypothetical protein
LKVIKKQLLRDLSFRCDLDHDMRIFRTYELTPTSVTVKSSWEKAGFGFQGRNEKVYLFLDSGKIRESPEFTEVWVIDYPEERLSPRRR